MDFIQAIEGAVGHPAEKIYLPMQPEMFIRQMQILQLCRMSWDLSLTNLLKGSSGNDRLVSFFLSIVIKSKPKII